MISRAIIVMKTYPIDMNSEIDKDNRNLRAAIWYAKNGWLVFPCHSKNGDRCSCGKINCHSPAKHPRTLYGLKDATTEIEKIKEMWGGWPDANIGLATGTNSGIFFLDVDPRHGGDESLEELERKYCPLPKTIESLTGGGGRHIGFVCNGHKIRSSAGKLGPGLDVRGEGGYVVLPPSIHISGQSYQWEVSGRPNEVEIADPPKWLLEVLKDRQANSPTPPDGKIPAGGRNSVLASLAGTMRRKGMSEASILAALQQENRLRCEPPLPEDEVAGIAKSVARYEPSAASALRFEKPSESKISLKFTSLKDLLAEPREETTWLVEGLLPSGGLSLFVAKPKVGKSTLARQLALAVSRGEDFLGREVKQGSVFYLALEERREDVGKHFEDMGGGDEPIKIFAGIAPVDAIQQVRRAIDLEQPALLIVDTLARLARIKDLNDYSQTTAGLEPFLAMGREARVHVCLLHHEKKGETKGIDSALGSIGIVGTVDTIICLKRSEKYRTISSIQRIGKDLEEVILRFDPTSRTAELGETKKDAETSRYGGLILEFLSDQKDPITEQVICENVEGTHGLKKAALRAVVNEGKILRQGSGKKADPYLYKNAGTPVREYRDVPEYQKQKSELNAQDQKENSGTVILNLFDSGTEGKSFDSEAPIPDKTQDNFTELALEAFPGAEIVYEGPAGD